MRPRKPLENKVIRSRRARNTWCTVPIALLIGVACLMAACGESPGVASLGSSTSTTISGGAGNSGGPPTAAQLKATTIWAGCVRKHGLPNFPDPPFSDGELNKLGFTKNSPQMLAANKACHADALAAGVVQTPAEIQQHLQQMLTVSNCMRAHGITTFPDPDSSGGFFMSPSVSNTPGYTAAAKTCGAPPG
jgi:hypothetical protein